jgi:hypothetical protein
MTRTTFGVRDVRNNSTISVPNVPSPAARDVASLRGALLPEPRPTLSDAAGRRLSNQIARVSRGTYGARTGLQTIVTALARQMLATGSSPAAIMLTFESCVLNHPARLDRDPQSVLTDDPNWALLVELTRQCVTDAARESSTR